MKKLAVLFTAAMLLPASAQAATIFGVDENNNLRVFDSADPGAFLFTRPITGTTATFLALDFRASNGLLYGLAGDYGLYTIDTVTGAASQIGSALALEGTNFGFDFNTVVDAIRVVGNLDDNYVVNADTGMVAVQATDVFFAPGDPNAAIDPIVSGNAYLPGSASQFAIETVTGSLVMQANNAGTLNTVGALGFAVGPRTSFDIGFNGMAYLQDVRGFYTVDLTSGAASFVGNTPVALFGITAAPSTAAIPEPSTWAMLLLGFGAVGGIIRRRARVSTRIAYA